MLELIAFSFGMFCAFLLVVGLFLTTMELVGEALLRVWERLCSNDLRSTTDTLIGMVVVVALIFISAALGAAFG